MNEDEWKRLYARFGSLPFNYYGALEEPHTDLPGEATVGDLADDLADIYRDIKNGLSLWSAGHRVEAVWKWRDDFRFHWGRHAADAIQALHVWLERERKL